MRYARQYAVILFGRRLTGDFPHCGGEEYEDWQYKVRIFLNSECSLFARFLTCLESLDREIDMQHIQGYATSEDFLGRPA